MAHTTTLRTLIQAPDLLVMPGIFDGFSARLGAQTGLPEVLRRLRLYAEAGADLLFADALVSAHDIATVARHVPKPLCVNMGFGIRARATTPLIAPVQLQALGVAVVIYPRLLTACAIQGMQHGVAGLRAAMQSPTVLERPELAGSL